LARAYHELTQHSPRSVSANAHSLDWSNQPLPFKIYTALDGSRLPTQFEASAGSALHAIAGVVPPDPARVLDRLLLAQLLYYANGITKMLRGMPFRAAACTGALYHIELYVACQDLPELEAGVYHYSAHDHSLRQLRGGDYRAELVDATGASPEVLHAQAIVALTSTFWRNSWKYQARAYRHSFWDSGTILANLLAVANAQKVLASLVVGFADAPVNRVLDVDPRLEAAVCLVALGANGAPPPPAPSVAPLDYPTRPLSAREVDYPAIAEALAATSLPGGSAAASWRAPGTAAPASAELTLPSTPPIEQVIAQRGSARRFSGAPIPLDHLQAILDAATQPIPSDIASRLTTPYLIVNAVDGLRPGAYVYRSDPHPPPLREGDFRDQPGFLDFGQCFADDAAVDVRSLTDLEDVVRKLGERGYRAAQLEGAIEGGKLYVAAYALGLGATGLTFFDDDVSRFFGVPEHAVMFLTALGIPQRSLTTRH